MAIKTPSEIAAPEAPVLLVVGDWLVDEHWVVGKHRALSSSRTGRDHSRALHGDRCSVRSLCGAGQVATILHQAKFGKRRPFQVSGIGIWHPDDTLELAAMLDPMYNVGKTPHRLKVETGGSEDIVNLYNLVRDPSKLGVTVGTTRVIRIYQSTGDRPDLKQRVDWELPLKESDLNNIHGSHNLEDALKPLTGQNIGHILIKDLLKGVVCERLITFLRDAFPDAKWYVSSKDWQPAWLDPKVLPRDQVELILIPQLAAKKAIAKGSIASSSWITLGGEPSSDALRAMSVLADKFRNAHIVVLPEGMRVLAQDSVAHAKRLFVQPTPGAADVLPFTPMASVFFPALVAHLVTQPIVSDKGADFSDMLKMASSFTETWEKAEARRVTEDDWHPTKDQVLRLSGMVETDQGEGAWQTFSWEHVNEAWASASRNLGIVTVQDPSSGKLRKEFHLWRCMTEIDGYVACIPSKRACLLRLLHEGRALVQCPREERLHKSFVIVDPAGSGKSFLVERLAKTLQIDYRTFNLTQLTSRSDLSDCFQRISAAQSEGSGNPLLIFIDEINARTINNQHVYDAFLEPLDDGTYVHAGKTFRLAPCLWIFAGTQRPIEATGGPSSKAEDFESRLTHPVMQLIDRGDLGKDEFAKVSAVERVYIGVATIRALYPDVKKISESVLQAFRDMPEDTKPRGLRRFVRSFEYIQYGRVSRINLPAGWHERMKVNDRVFENWMNTPEDEASFVEIRSQQDGYLISSIRSQHVREKRKHASSSATRSLAARA